MKNIDTLLSEIGYTIPEEHKEAFTKSFNENYKTVAEVGKISSKADSYKEQLETATATLKKFEGIDPAKINEELEGWKKKAEDAETEYNAKLAARDYDEALNKAMGEIKFSSSAAKRSITAQVKDANLPLKNGKLMGLNDLLETLKEEDADAFVSVDESNKARFTSKQTVSEKRMTKEEILAIKDTSKRQAAISANIDLFS